MRFRHSEPLADSAIDTACGIFPRQGIPAFRWRGLVGGLRDKVAGLLPAGELEGRTTPNDKLEAAQHHDGRGRAIGRSRPKWRREGFHARAGSRRRAISLISEAVGAGCPIYGDGWTSISGWESAEENFDRDHRVESGWAVGWLGGTRRRASDYQGNCAKIADALDDGPNSAPAEYLLGLPSRSGRGRFAHAIEHHHDRFCWGFGGVDAMYGSGGMARPSISPRGTSFGCTGNHVHLSPPCRTGWSFEYMAVDLGACSKDSAAAGSKRRN